MMELAGRVLVGMVLVAMGIAGPTTSYAQKFQVDNSHSSLVFAVNHFGLSYTYGRFNQIHGSFELVNGELTNQGFTFTIDTESVDTNQEERDSHLRGPDFFNVQQFPEIKFQTTGLQKTGDQYLVTGDMQILDQIRPVKFTVSRVGVGKGPFGELRAGYFTKFSIKRSEFGMDKMIGSIGDEVSITFSFEGLSEK